MRNAVNPLGCVRKTQTFNTHTVLVVTHNEARTRQLAMTILHGTSPQRKRSSTIAVAEVQMKKDDEKQSEIGPENSQQKG